jgi:hypothetical protein
MTFTRYADPQVFYDQALPLLVAHEAENNLMLGIGARIAKDKHHYSNSDPILGIAFVHGEPRGAVLMTPPHRLALTRMPPAMVAHIAGQLANDGISLPGVLGPKETAADLVAAWLECTGQRAELTQSMRIYQLNHVLPVPTVPGRCVEAGMDDRETLLNWMPSYFASVGERTSSVDELVRQYIADKNAYLWKIDIAVSMAASASPTPNGIRINNVYTPPECRNRGYATANVVALSQRMLDTGRRFCFLYTDLANPTSNSIYQKIGYRPVCDADAYRIA